MDSSSKRPASRVAASVAHAVLPCVTLACATLALACAHDTAGPDTGSPPGARTSGTVRSQGLDFQGVLDVMESFPVQLAGKVTITNPGSSDRRIDLGSCVPLIRVYRPGEDEPVWDQAEEVICPAVLIRHELAPGESIELHGPRASAADILNVRLPDGTYRVTLVVQPVEGDEVELEVGTVDLAIPRCSDR